MLFSSILLSRENRERERERERESVSVCVFWVGGTIALRATEGRKHGAAETEGCGELVCVVDDRRLWSVSLRVHGKSGGNLILRSVVREGLWGL